MLGRQIGRVVRQLPTAISTLEAKLKQIKPYNDASLKASKAIHAVVRSNGAARSLADVLHGVWLGHPLHPLLTDIPITSWALASGFDAYAALTGSEEAAWAADTLVVIGVGSAVPASLAGMADYSAIPKDAATLGATHGLLNGVGVLFYLLSIGARRNDNRATGGVLALVGLGVISASSAMGADLIYRLQVGVNHVKALAKPTNWQRVATLDDLTAGGIQKVDVEGTGVLVYYDGDDVYAIASACNHANGKLEDGKVANNCVECPLHHSVFDLRDGSVVHGPATVPQPRYDARIRDGQVEVRVSKLVPAYSEGLLEQQRRELND